MPFRVAGARDCAPCQSQQKREGVVAASKILAGVGHLNTIRKEAFRLAGTAQEPCSSEMLGGLGADFLRGHLSVHQWIRSAIPDSQQPTSP